LNLAGLGLGRLRVVEPVLVLVAPVRELALELPADTTPPIEPSSLRQAEARNS